MEAHGPCRGSETEGKNLWQESPRRVLRVGPPTGPPTGPLVPVRQKRESHNGSDADRNQPNEMSRGHSQLRKKSSAILIRGHHASFCFLNHVAKDPEDGFFSHDLGIDEQIKRGSELAILGFTIKFRKTKNKGIDS